MGMFGFLKKKGETIELPPEEPEFLRKIDLSGAEKVTEEAAQGIKGEVEPELAIWLSNGTAAKGLKELASALRKMKTSDYKGHVNPERNEIAEWVQEILNDPGLARKLRQAKGKLQAAKAVENEIKALKAAKNPSRARHDWAQSTKVDLGAAHKTMTTATRGTAAAAELQDIPLLDIPAEKPQAKAAKGGLFSRLFGKKPKEKEQEQHLESAPILPEITMPEPTEEPKATETKKETTKKLTKKERRAVKKASKATAELLPQLQIGQSPIAHSAFSGIVPQSEEIQEAAGEKFETPIEMPRIEDFQKTEPIEPLTEEAPETKREGKGILGFLFKRKESHSKEEPKSPKSDWAQSQKRLGKQKAEIPEAATEIDAAIATAAEAPAMPELAKSLPAPEFEPEPQHAKWEETPTPAEAATDYSEKLKPASTAASSRKSSKTKKGARQHEEYENIELVREGNELERTEKELTREEEELNNKRLELTRKRYELIKQKGELEKKKFEEFIRKHKNRNEKEETIVKEGLDSQESIAAMPDFGNKGSEPTGRLRGMPDFRLSLAYGKERLEQLLEEAKQHIRQNNMDEAQNALHEVQSVLDTVYMTNNEKKQIEYEILEVEADIKLASLK